MPDINDIHRFYELNLPEYQRRDINRINAFFLEKLGWGTKKPLKKIWGGFQRFKEFVVHEWLGADGIALKREKPSKPKESAEQVVDQPATKEQSPQCLSCKKNMVKRQNRSDHSYFWGCSSYPKCRQTKPYLE